MTSTLGHPAGHEFALDSDGTVGWVTTTNTSNGWAATAASAPASSATLKAVQDWGGSQTQLVGTGSNGSSALFGYMFPQPRQLTAWSANIGTITNISIEVSNDATSLDTGTWRTIVSSSTAFRDSTVRGMRVPAPINESGVVGVRVAVRATSNTWMYNDFHLWGYFPKAGLEFWHPTLDQRLEGAEFDFGDIVQGSVHTIPFRVKNNHATLTANSVVVGSGPPAVATLQAGLTFSDGGVYGTNVVVPSLAPGQISGVLSMRRTVAAAATLGAGVTRVNATAGSWT
jgi:hypothetical protein